MILQRHLRNLGQPRGCEKILPSINSSLESCGPKSWDPYKLFVRHWERGNGSHSYHPILSHIRDFQKWGYPNSWMVYNLYGKRWRNLNWDGWFGRGPLLLGNPQVSKYVINWDGLSHQFLWAQLMEMMKSRKRIDFQASETFKKKRTFRWVSAFSWNLNHRKLQIKI